MLGELLLRERRIWGLPAVLVLVNLLVMVALAVGWGSRDRRLDQVLEEARTRHAEGRERLGRLEGLWRGALEVREATYRLYSEGFGTEPARWTAMVRRIREIADQAGLDPKSVTYPAEELVEHGLTRRSVVFSVEGDFRALRTFLHLLEAEPQFVIVEQIAVGERAAGRLELSLRLVSYFGRAPEEAISGPPLLPGRGVGGLP